MAATKRKLSSIDGPATATNGDVPPFKRRASARKASTAASQAVVNPDINADVLDAPDATRASPDSDVNESIIPTNGIKSESPLSDAPDVVEPPPKKRSRAKKASQEAVKNVHEAEEVVSAVVDAAEGKVQPARTPRAKKVKQEVADQTSETPVKAALAKKSKKGEEQDYDPEAEDGEEAVDEDEVKEALSRPPPVNSDYLPLPWKGRLGYACLNTYLRNATPPVFCSRTCRIQSILEHRHPLQDSSQPEHPTKNKPDRSEPADVELGQRYVEALCLANLRDLPKMLRWNDKYNIKFMRLSSEMFPFASHPEYGYKLTPFASEALAEVGKVVAELGHRVTTHPGQFTQLGSPRRSVIENAIRDLEYHDEMLSLLKLPEQQDKDAVMILHMGGIFEGKAETIARFKEEYVKLPQSVKNRLVLENDDMGWSVHDILPVCEELNIPMVLDYHHHNIVFDPEQIREGTKDVIDLYPRITATWTRKGITQKMHYSEPTPPAITKTQRRKHNPRVATLPPCAPDMDLMIEAKDKEQAVFELMRTFKLPGFDRINDVLAYTRADDNKHALQSLNKKKKKPNDEPEPAMIPDEDVAMGGPEGRVYWPPGMEEWLRPKKREVKKKAEPADGGGKTKAQIKKEAEEAYSAREAAKSAAAAVTNGGVKREEEEEEGEEEEDMTAATKKARAAMRKKEVAGQVKEQARRVEVEAKKMVREAVQAGKVENGGMRKKRAWRGKRVSYVDVDVDEDEEGGYGGVSGISIIR
ncbi:UV-damage endonuclease [Meristemomyces frigidus]|uniref:UV-damage endonuclease n=1 Tax=Meristemomyces frigidus TaxID=1508187 RepID=A0AAN7TDX5_9PEZI|nr:UV-damage endonuclease [Meristemomyces frigidus]